MLFRILILVFCLLILNACGNNDGSSEGTSSSGGDSSGGGTTEVSLEGFSGVKLILTSGAGLLESDYYLYPDGIADYVVRSFGNSYPPITRLQWTLEGNSLFVNNGSKKLGDAHSSPKELQFDYTPEVGNIVRVNSGNTTFANYVIIGIETAAHVDVNLNKEDFYGKAFEFSSNGSTSYTSVARLKFSGPDTGMWEATHHYRSFTWSMASENSVRVEYESGDFSEYEFRFGMELGEHVFVLRDQGLGHLSVGETIFVNSYLL